MHDARVNDNEEASDEYERKQDGDPCVIEAEEGGGKDQEGIVEIDAKGVREGPLCIERLYSSDVVEAEGTKELERVRSFSEIQQIVRQKATDTDKGQTKVDLHCEYSLSSRSIR